MRLAMVAGRCAVCRLPGWQVSDVFPLALFAFFVVATCAAHVDKARRPPRPCATLCVLGAWGCDVVSLTTLIAFRHLVATGHPFALRLACEHLLEAVW